MGLAGQEARVEDEDTMDEGPQEPIIEVLDEEWAAISELGDTLDLGEWELPSECPGWTVRDVLSHLIGDGAVTARRRRSRPLSEPPHVENEVGARNEAWVVAPWAQSGPDVLGQFRDVTARRLAELRSWPDSRFDEVGPSPVGEVPYREFMHVRVMDSWVHEQDIRVATARPGHERGPAAEPARRPAVRRPCPSSSASRRRLPRGRSVRFELTRVRCSRRIDVAVQRRPGQGGDRCPGGRSDHRTATWTSRCSGASPAAGCRARRPVSPDWSRSWATRNWRRRVVDSMAFMI